MTPNELPLCPHCEEPLLEGERLAPDFRPPLHYECGLRMAVGSVGHQKQACFCFGGTEEDPPGLSRREAAQAAALYFHLGRLPDDFLKPRAD